MKTNALVLCFLTLSTGSLSAYCSQCNQHSNYRHGYYDRDHSIHRDQSYNRNYSAYEEDYQLSDGQFASETDKNIFYQIQQNLENANLNTNPNDLQVSIQSGYVVINGRIIAEEDRQTIRNAIGNIPGVRFTTLNVTIDKIPQPNRNNMMDMDQRNNMNMQPHNRGSYGEYNQYNDNGIRDQDRYYDNDSRYQNNNSGDMISDRELEIKVRSILKGGWFSQSYPNVHVQVTAGNVSLTGFVETKEEMHKLEDRVRDISGVQNVSNMVEIKNSRNGSMNTNGRYNQ